MKSFKAILAIVALFLISCQENDDTTLQITESLQDSEESKVNFNDPVPLEEPWLSWDTVEFEIFVSDIGRLTALAIMTDAGAEAQFRGTMIDNGGVVTLDKLLGPNVPMQHFYDSFEQAYNLGGSSHGCRPDGFEPRPFPNGRSAVAFATYLNSILYDHCIELYMPELYNPNQEEVTTVSHPLNGNKYNNGHLHTRNSTGVGCVVEVDGQYVNSKFSNSYTNLIIARPNPDDGGIATSNGTYCDYTIYDGIDFTIWFGN
jgi:hypothetical protein